MIMDPVRYECGRGSAAEPVAGMLAYAQRFDRGYRSNLCKTTSEKH